MLKHRLQAVISIKTIKTAISKRSEPFSPPSRIKLHTESEKTTQNAWKRLKDPNRQS